MKNKMRTKLPFSLFIAVFFTGAVFFSISRVTYAAVCTSYSADTLQCWADVANCAASSIFITEGMCEKYDVVNGVVVQPGKRVYIKKAGIVTVENGLGEKVKDYDPAAAKKATKIQAIKLNGRYDYTPLESTFISKENAELPNFLKYIFNVGIAIVGMAALLMMTIGGLTYIMSAGNNATAESAKKMIRDATMGLLLAFFSWFILFVINPDLVGIGENLEKLTAVSKFTMKNADGGGLAPGPGGAGQQGGAGAGQQGGQTQYDAAHIKRESDTRKFLRQKNISINKAACKSPSSTNCTDVGGLPDKSLQALAGLKQECPQCTVMVTGGSEESGHKSHGPGKDVFDLAINSGLEAQFVQNGTENAPIPKFGSTTNAQNWTINSGALKGAKVVRETNPPHYHIYWP